MKSYIPYYIYIVMLLAMVSCGKKTWSVPTTYNEVDSTADIYPDYKDVVIPSNIAPLNFMVKGASELVVEMQGNKGGMVCGGTDRIDMDTTEWRQLLADNRGGDIRVTVYARFNEEKFQKYQSHTISVAKEDIDPYLSYRLIEPGYELYRQLGLYQRNLTNFHEVAIYENNRTFSEDDNHCVNCHNYKNNSTEEMLFHVRASHGGTIIINGDKAKKIAIKDDNILAAGVYPSWHPTLPLIAFSSNMTGQVFHMYHAEKIEVLDEKSDLILYDVEKNEVRNILNDKMQLETFPCWAPTGDRLYYCVAQEPIDPEFPDTAQAQKMMAYYDSLLYDIKYIDFDQKTRHFGEPQTLVNWSAQKKSATFPKVSPDGRYLLYAVGDYGQFHIWHKSSDLWVTDLKNDSTYALSEANSDDVDSYHTWSSNSRWIVFSSRRQDGNYTRPFIAYFNKEGRAHKAFPLPQQDPEHDILLLKSYNVPELTKDAVRIKQSTLKQCIYETEGTTAKYVEK